MPAMSLPSTQAGPKLSPMLKPDKIKHQRERCESRESHSHFLNRHGAPSTQAGPTLSPMLKQLGVVIRKKHGIGVPERRGGAQRSQPRATAGPVVGGLEAPGAHPGRGPRGVRKVRNAGPVRARRCGRGVPCHRPAGGLRSRQRLSPQPLSERPSPCSSIPAWACTATFRRCPGT